MSKSESKSAAEQQRQESDDAVLSMLGIGKHLWERESGDRFIERLRSEDLPAPLSTHQLETSAENSSRQFGT